jgi:hypothetical protein
MDRGGARVDESRELGLDRDAVAVAAVEPDPGQQARVEQESGSVGRWELDAGGAGVTGEDGVDVVAEEVAAGGDRGSIECAGGEVGDDEGAGGEEG